MGLRMIWTSVVLVSALTLVVCAGGEEMTFTLPKAGLSSTGKCVFPDSLPVHIFSPSRGRHWTIQLRRNNVIPLSRSVMVMRSDNVIEEVPVDGSEHRGVSGYHNRHDGAAFLVKCVPVGLYKSTFRLEGSIFVDNHKYTVDPTPTWLDSLHTSSPTQETSFYTLAEVKEFRAQDSATRVPLTEDYHWSPHASTEHRVKRQTNTIVNYYIDVLPILDSNLFNIFYNRSGSNMTQAYKDVADYMSRMLTGVNMRLDTLVLGTYNLQFRLIKPLILTNISQGPYSLADVETKNNSKSISATVLLNFFKTWLTRNLNLSSYDTAMFLTALDIYGGGDNGIKFNVTTGLAFVGGMCMDQGMSSSVIEDKGAFQNEGVAAHELTHALGSYHDGENNTCQSSDRFLMSDGEYPATNASLLNPWKTSPCTSDYVLAHLKKMENDAVRLKCLQNTIGEEVSQVEVVSADEQCRIFYGNSSFVCRGPGVPPLDTICDEFYCNIPGRNNVCGRLTAATGTCCGNKKKCIRGQCVSSLSGECPLDDVCPLGDQPGIIMEGKNCSFLPLNYCYLDDVFLKCCQTCSKKMLPEAECPYGDKLTGCNSSNCGSFFKDGIYKDVSYSAICCSTCNNTCLDRQNVNYSGVNYTCSDLIFNQGEVHICYQEGVRNSSCCKSCEEARDSNIPNCPWGDENICSKFLTYPPSFRCNATQYKMCCKTCYQLETRIIPMKANSSSTTTLPTTTTATSTSSSQTWQNQPNPITTTGRTNSTTPRRISDLFQYLLMTFLLLYVLVL